MAGFFSLLRRLYLTAYNFTLFVGWFQVLYIVLKTLKESGHESIYHAAEKPLLFAQTAAVLEVLFWERSSLLLQLQIICSFFFGLKEAFGSAPSWLLWLRYSTFLVLYPTGISSEVGLIYIAFPFIKASEKYCIRMPNKWNFSFDYFCAANVVLGIYVPGLNSILTTNALCLIFLFLINLVSH
ncbi:hypothetical protein JHK87_002984 [Glycine soja]|nr:hypothetical protein JHK87_002984 [Glycine soja]KAG5079081.1 hypothetical protein JHK86_003146 [Glycine max]